MYCFFLKFSFMNKSGVLQRSPEWPEIFKSTALDDSSGSLNIKTNDQLERE
ncbi:hypothetical protein NC652_041789 [Populus alba x Populus x berolinensis]|nr:hypothetical protein NC652_041789 [Populus alba x Populus x berolinensis]